MYYLSQTVHFKRFRPELKLWWNPFKPSCQPWEGITKGYSKAFSSQKTHTRKLLSLGFRKPCSMPQLLKDLGDNLFQSQDSLSSICLTQVCPAYSVMTFTPFCFGWPSCRKLALFSSRQISFVKLCDFLRYSLFLKWWYLFSSFQDYFFWNWGLKNNNTHITVKVIHFFFPLIDAISIMISWK